MNGRYHTPEFKKELARQVESGEKRPAQLCREHKIAESSLLKWRKEYRERGEAAFTPTEPGEIRTDKTGLEARIAELERFCGQLALENTVLKKTLQLTRTRTRANSKNDTNS